MFVSDRLIYLQLQKTACTHIEKVLQTHLDGKQIGKHGPLTFDPGNRLILGSIRNPFDWYVSLWSYGCQRRGYIHSALTQSSSDLVRRHLRERGRNPRRWPEMLNFLRRAIRHDPAPYADFYADANDPARFQGWLAHILAKPYRPYLQDGYPQYAIDDQIGLMTYRFMRLFVDHAEWMKRNRLSTAKEVAELHRRASICSTFIRMENLEEDLAKVLTQIGIAKTPDDLKTEKINTSSHRPYAEYYDDQATQLVRQRDALILDTFGYDLGS